MPYRKDIAGMTISINIIYRLHCHRPHIPKSHHPKHSPFQKPEESPSSSHRSLFLFCSTLRCVAAGCSISHCSLFIPVCSLSSTVPRCYNRVNPHSHISGHPLGCVIRVGVLASQVSSMIVVLEMARTTHLLWWFPSYHKE